MTKSTKAWIIVDKSTGTPAQGYDGRLMVRNTRRAAEESVRGSWWAVRRCTITWENGK